MTISEDTLQILREYQKNEITEHHIYKRIAAVTKKIENRKVLTDIAEDELRHYNQWKEYTREDIQPDRGKVFRFVLISRIFGLTFAVRFMEHAEEGAQVHYDDLIPEIPQALDISKNENEHENKLLELLDEKRLRYTGSMVLGLNDALVELTGALAGFTFALQNTDLIALTGSITGFAAALSMGASEYLSTKAEGDDTKKKPIKASLYTGTAYLLTVILLIFPYLILENSFLCLGCTLALAILIIAVFNFYISVANGQSFRARFFEMAGLSLGVAGLSFVAGFLLRTFVGVTT